MRVVLTGASGQLGGYLWDRLLLNGHEVIGWSGHQVFGGLRAVDLNDGEAIARALARDVPDAIIHTAAISSAEEVRRDRERGRAVNVEATARLAEWCERNGRRFLFTSTDLVFDGSRPFYREDDPAEPTLTYGKTKVEAEPFARAVASGLVVRLSLLYGPARRGRPTYLDRTVAGLRRGEPQTFFEDEYRTPLDLATAATVLVKLVENGTTGLVHVGGRERLSRYELGRRVAVALGLDSRLVRANRQCDVPSIEPRPADVSLDSARLDELLPGLNRPGVEEAVVVLWGSQRS